MKLTEAQVEERERLRQAEMKVHYTCVQMYKTPLFNLLPEGTGKG